MPRISILLSCLAVGSFSLASAAWPKVQMISDFMLTVPKVYRWVPSANLLKPLDGMQGTIKVDSTNNRLLVDMVSQYPGNNLAGIYWLQDFGANMLYEQTTKWGSYCNKWPTTYGITLTKWLNDELYSESAGVTQYQGESALPWGTSLGFYKFYFPISIGTF